MSRLLVYCVPDRALREPHARSIGQLVLNFDAKCFRVSDVATTKLHKAFRTIIEDLATGHLKSPSNATPSGDAIGRERFSLAKPF